jgi:hypothetical protein
VVKIEMSDNLHSRQKIDYKMNNYFEKEDKQLIVA